MTDRIPLDAMTSDQLDALYDELDQLRADLARQSQEMATWRATANALDAGEPGTPRDRAERAEAAIARAENLRDKWLAWPESDQHHAAGLMLAQYLDGTAYGSDEPRPTPTSPCPGFPDRCPNPVDVPAQSPYHGGGTRCGCDDPKEN